MNPNDSIRTSFSNWFYDPTANNKQFKKALFELSKNMKKNGKGFITLKFKDFGDYFIFVGDNSKVNVDYRVVKEDKVPPPFKNKFENANLDKEFLLYVIFGTGKQEITLMDVIPM